MGRPKPRPETDWREVVRLWPEERREWWEERAAIMEYDGRMTREAAEEAAFRVTLDYFVPQLDWKERTKR